MKTDIAYCYECKFCMCDVFANARCEHSKDKKIISEYDHACEYGELKTN